jgi:lipoprotein-releasing system permease protein
MFLVAILNLCTALLILILERTNMIGILKAIGASNWTSQQIFLIQAGAIIAKGLAVGNILGIGICLIQKYGHIIKLPAESYYVTEAPVAIDLVWIIGLNIITFIVCILCLILPSMYITKISPVKSIRFN